MSMALQRIKYRDLEESSPRKIQKDFRQDFQGSAPAPFIGRFGYPQVHIGLLSPQFLGDTKSYDSPRLWSEKNWSIPEIANKRYEMVNSRQSWNVKQLQKENRFLDILQEAGMASQAVEVEVNLKSAPKLNYQKEKEIMPFGPSSELRKITLTSNPKVDSRVDKVVSDTDLKATEALEELYKKGFEDNFLQKLLSVGNLGLKGNRKLVPTRWSITAVDDTLGKKLIAEVKDFSLGEYQLFFGGGWGNYYLICFFPQIWSYELFETYLEQKMNPWSATGQFYSTDYENYEGRKEYAEECAGGYYAARLALLEKMKVLKRQHSALVLRFITPEYNIPLGVWVCREASRKALQEKSISFGSQELMFQYAEELIKRKFGFEINLLLKESHLLKEKKVQKSLNDF